MKVFEGVIRNLGARLRRIHGNKGPTVIALDVSNECRANILRDRETKEFFFFPLLCPRRKT